jgi:deoxyribodipyrimidine photo-lyase
MTGPPVLLWFRQDLRLADNPALAAASAHGAVIPLFVLDETTPGRWRWGAAKRWRLHHSLAALDRSLRARGARLILRRGPAIPEIERILAETGAGAVFWNRCYEPFMIDMDRAIKAALKARGIAVYSFNAALLVEPWDMATGEGKPYAVFTPFWWSLRRRAAPGRPTPPPARLPAPSRWPVSDLLDSWSLLPPGPNWAAHFREAGEAGEAAARERLAQFVDNGLADYAAARNRPDRVGTSRLSAALALGEIGPRQVWYAIAAAAADPARAAGAEAFLRELGWREFCHHLLFHAPALPERNWRAAFDAFPWRDDTAGLEAWKRGRTGYPIVDAGMRQLWRSGWMHNRVRMIAASFLVKDLLIDWRQGQAWFWDTLVDADLANNAAGWQWVAGSGADAAPYFRIFNPVLQGRRFDPQGDFVRRNVPELARLPAAFIHEPWKAPADVLAAAGLALGRDYPLPIVDHATARGRALDAYRQIRDRGTALIARGRPRTTGRNFD